MKKLILLLTLTFGFAFSAFAEEFKSLTVEIRKNGDLVSSYKAVFNGLPGEQKRTTLISYVKEIKDVKAQSGLYDVVMGQFETGTAFRFDRSMVEVVIYDDVKIDTYVDNGVSIQRPQYSTYKVSFPSKLTTGMVPVAQISDLKVSYSLE